MRPGQYRKEGRKAYRDGIPIEDCPFKHGIEDWREGWRDAAIEEERLHLAREKETSPPYYTLLYEVGTVGELYELLEQIKRNQGD